MSGVAIVRYLLANNTALLALVPAARIKAGDLPINTVLPAISITSISSIPRNIVSMETAKRFNTDRVQVTVLVKNTDGSPSGSGYPGLKTILDAVVTACPLSKGAINGFTCGGVYLDSEGPDLADDAVSILQRSRDFFVSWNSP